MGRCSLASHERRSRLDKCVARRSELEIETIRTAAALSRTGSSAFEVRELPPEVRCLLRKLGALAIELAEIDREVAMLTGSRARDPSAVSAPGPLD